MRAASSNPPQQQQQQQCRVVHKHEFSPKGFRWLTLQRIEWQGPDGRSRFWEAVERQTTVKDELNVDGADAVAVVAKSSSSSRLLIIKQFRPPVGGHVLELPAGLIDSGETPAQAACRELKEECGYTGLVSSISPVVFNDPGITNANMMLAVVDVDLTSQENQDVEQSLHEGEFIECFWAPYGPDLLEWLLLKKQEEGVEVDARLMMMAIGYHQACVDIDFGVDTERRAAPVRAEVAARDHVDDEDGREEEEEEEREKDRDEGNSMIRRMSSRSNQANLKKIRVKSRIGAREVVAWGVAAVMTLASIMR